MRHTYRTIDKKIGETPRNALERFREKERISLQTPLTYAGRLDPMAEGKLLVLVGEECKRQDIYRDLDKVYEFEILFDISSDTGDVLGCVTHHERSNVPSLRDIKRAMKSFLGHHTFPYPHYSSKTVKGKPLFLWALEKRLDEITIPRTSIHVYKMSFESQYSIEVSALEKIILQKISLLTSPDTQLSAISNDFRRPEILTQWKHIFETLQKEKKFTVLKMRITCSSGTYVRTLSEKIAEALDTHGLALSIKRTKIGKYISFPIFPGHNFGFFIKTF